MLLSGRPFRQARFQSLHNGYGGVGQPSGLSTNRRSLERIDSIMGIFLLMSRPGGGFNPIHVTCALSGDSEDLRGTTVQFEQVHNLSEALIEAGMPLDESKVPLQVLINGYSTFMSVSAEVARRMGVLEQASSRATPVK